MTCIDSESQVAGRAGSSHPAGGLLDSPGGSVYGVSELADEIMNARAQKPVIAIANSLAASAAYWIGCSASELYVTPGGEVGSIGVWQAHFDYSQALAAEGVTPTLISAGKYKVEGNPYAPLGEDALGFMQSRVDDYYAVFTKSVARGRGVPIAQRIAAELHDLTGVQVPTGALDITLYRDDLMGASVGVSPLVRKTEIPFSIDGRTIILVDDVLFTGRTTRAALDALTDFGRPKSIQLVVLVDRGHRELPIKADYVGKNVPTSRQESVQVTLRELDGADEVVLQGKE